MKRSSVLFVWLLAASACSVGERPTLTDEVIEVDDGSTGRGAEAASVTAYAEDDSLDLGEPADAPPVLVTPSGVIVAVLGRSDHGYLVRTPCGGEAEILWGHPVDPVDVVIDPGHGGDERGALGPSGETEAEVNLDVARRVAALLEQRGFTVALTRTADYRLPIRDRAAIADRLGAEALVSIHHNSPSPDISEQRQRPGTEVYVQVASPDSQRLGGLLYEEVLGAIEVFDADWASRSDAGVLRVLNERGEDAYGMNRHPGVPSALVELAYLSNPSEAVVIGTVEYRQAAAGAVADAVTRYLETDDVGSGYVEEPRLFTPSAETGGTEGCVDPALE